MTTVLSGKDKYTSNSYFGQIQNLDLENKVNFLIEQNKEVVEEGRAIVLESYNNSENKMLLLLTMSSLNNTFLE